jgi:hypothetical protein
LNTQLVGDEFGPLKIRWAALPVVGCDGQVREAVTKASALVDAEFVSTDGLNKWSALAQVLVVGVDVNSGLVPVVDSL